MTLKDNSSPLESDLKAAIKHAEDRGDTREAGHLGDILGLYRKGQVGDSVIRTAARAEMNRVEPTAR